MKKYLLAAIMAVAATGAFVSCSDDVVSSSLIEQKAKAFENTLIEAFGQPAPNHTWGFKTNNITEANGVTRTVHKRDPEQGFDYEHEPPAVTQKEADYVYKWFQEHEGLTPRGLDWDTFYLQQVYGTMDKQKLGMWNKYDQNIVIRNEGDGWTGDQPFEDKGGMDYLILTDNNGYVEHVNDFNAEAGGPYGIVYMTNSSALYFGYHSTWDNSERQLFKLAQITVPGECFGEGEADRTAWYVGLSLYGEKWNQGKEGDSYKNQRIGVQRYNWGDDWILKVVPGVSTPPPPSYKKKVIEVEEVKEAGRVFCEDLGASKLNDIDYNDVVFDAIIVNEYNKLVTYYITEDGDEVITSQTTEFPEHYDRTFAKVCLLAAGGTVPANVCGHEIHDELSGDDHLSTSVMINTTDNPEDVNGAQIAYGYGPVIIQETVDGSTVDKKFYVNSEDKPITCINDVDIVVKYGNAVTKLTAISEDSEVPAVPYKICVPIGTPWAKERVNIGIAFTSFADYYGINPDIEFWKDINKEGSPVWTNCSSLFTITENGVTRYIDEGDVLSYTESEYTGSGGNGGVSRGLIWASTDDAGTEVGYGNNVIVSYDKFTNASATSTIRLNFSYAGSNWQFFAKYGNSDNPFKQIGNYNNISTMSVTSGGYVDFEIGEALTGLQQNGLKIHGNELKISSIELR